MSVEVISFEFPAATQDQHDAVVDFLRSWITYEPESMPFLVSFDGNCTLTLTEPKLGSILKIEQGVVSNRPYVVGYKFTGSIVSTLICNILPGPVFVAVEDFTQIWLNLTSVAEAQRKSNNEQFVVGVSQCFAK